MRLRPPPHFILALLEALLKCAPAVVIQLIAMYPLIASGQGQESARALLDPRPANVSMHWFAIAVGYSSMLTASFLFFLLGKWNYPAPDAAHAFCRIWIPSILTLMVSLLWPSATIFDVIVVVMNLIPAFALPGVAWLTTKPELTIPTKVYIAAMAAVLLGTFIFGPLSLFYAFCFVALTLFCMLIYPDFRDPDDRLPPWRPVYVVGLFFAALFICAVLFLSTTAVPWRMFLGTPAIVVCGFSFLTAIAFWLCFGLSRISPVLVRASWLLLAILLLFAPINHEPLRLLQPVSHQPPRLPPSAHFINWLRARPEALSAAKPYPVFFVTAQGGGVRAAYWTSTLLAGFEERYPGFTNHLYAISGVSGGSVGAAVFTSMYRDLPARGNKGCAPLVTGGLHSLRACTAYLFQWDLLGPALSGLLFNDIPFGLTKIRRATDLEQALEYAWFGSMETRRFEDPFDDLWRDRPYTVPTLILNTTSADTGARIVVSNVLAQPELTSEADVEQLAGRPIRLSTASFASARFPVISPLATFETSDKRRFRLADGGYFNNSGLASIAELQRAVLPAVQHSEFAGRIRPIVLVISSSPSNSDFMTQPTRGSVAEALLDIVSVLAQTGDAHDATYMRDVTTQTGADWVFSDLRPPRGSGEVALGWQLSAETRSRMDEITNQVLSNSKASAAIQTALGYSP